MDELCVDASLIIKLVLRAESMREHARQLYRDASLASAILIAPPVFESEIDSIVRSRVFTGRLTSEQARAAFSAVDQLIIDVMNPSGLRKRAREIAEQFNQAKVYDSTYAALAELRGCEFWTADRAFYAAVNNDLPFVRYLADYPIP